jgi:hypothetical protein
MVVPTVTDRLSSVKLNIGEFTTFPTAGAGVDVGGTCVGGTGVGGIGVGGTGVGGIGVGGIGVGGTGVGGMGVGGIGVGVAMAGDPEAPPVTVMVAVICGCTVQKYGNAPGSSKVKLKASP